MNQLILYYITATAVVTGKDKHILYKLKHYYHHQADKNNNTWKDNKAKIPYLISHCILFRLWDKKTKIIVKKMLILIFLRSFPLFVSTFFFFFLQVKMPFLSLHLIEDFGIAHVLLMVCRVHLVSKIVLNNDFLYKMKTSFYGEKKNMFV